MIAFVDQHLERRDIVIAVEVRLDSVEWPATGVKGEKTDSLDAAVAQ